MKHKTTADFWDCYDALPEQIQRLADKNFNLLKANPRHPSLRFKKIHTDLWSARVGKDYRALAAEDGPEMAWFYIGHHSEYDKLIAQ